MKKLLCSLLGLLCTQVCWVKGQQVKQSPVSLVLQEGESAEMQCNSSTNLYQMQWFYQSPGGHLINLLSNPSGKKQSGRLTSTTVTQERRSSLYISSSQTTDSGTYFCAMALYNFNAFYFGSGTKLSVKPNIKDPKPAVYELRDPQSKNSSICLFTDFDSQINVSKDMASDVFVFDKTVLDMKSMDSKSNGAIAWSNQSSFNCKDAFKENASYPSSDVPCDAKLIEKSFETDMNLNFQNLSVMGHRILLLKVAGFNLLMTLRLWSS